MLHRAQIKIIKRVFALLLSIILFIGLLPPFTVNAAGGLRHDFSSGAVVIDSGYNGDTIYIYDGVFSVTVIGATDVTIRFVDVTIDRYHDEGSSNVDELDNTVVPKLYEASSKLPGNTGNTIKALVCPFYITGNSTVTAGFTGNCTFFAGTNASTVTTNDTYNAVDSGGGYAGIQVDKGSSLTITDADNLKVFGAHQITFPDLPLPTNPDDPVTITVSNKKYTYSDVLRANRSIDNVYTDPYYPNGIHNNAYYTGPTGTQFSQSGGAGIGGGVAFNTSSSATSSYTNGTPGTIIINGGNIEAFGGYAAAGIGGGVNGAATNSEIVINGGTVIAHGGRFAAGIGDGDSVPKNDGLSPSFNTAEGRIEINGGTVTAYGGVASAGIGCTDDMSSSQGSGQKSQLEIAINGGVVRAYSGFPKEFTGSNADGSPAAIGAGSISQMESNSIYISSESDLLCAGFGEYSLTEDGRKSGTQAAPVINLDSDGYLLLLKTGSYVSTAERTLKMWLPQTETITVADTELLCTKYVIQDNDDPNKIYYRYTDAQTGESTFYEYNETDGKYYQTEDKMEGFTLYVDEYSKPALDPNGVPIEIDLAYYFRSMAITLPDPAEQGGLYAITVPTNGVSSNTKPKDGAPIILTVEAREQGTQSGTVTYPTDHNLDIENTAEKLTDLDVYTDDSSLPTNGLIGEEFKPGVYAYTVYVEPNVTVVSLQAEYKDGGKQYSLSLNGNNLTPTATGNAAYRVESPITLTADTTVVRLRKQDGSNSLGAITYEVTIIRKAEYLLDLSDPRKIYDGTPAVPSPEGVGKYEYGNSRVEPTEETTSTTTEWEKEPYTDSTSYSSTVYITRSRTGNSSNYRYYIADLNLTWEARPVEGKNAVQYIIKVVTSKNSSSQSLSGLGTWYAGWEVTYTASGNGYTATSKRITAQPSYISNNWIGDKTQQVIAVGNNTNLNLVLSDNGARLTTGTNTAVVSNSTYLFSISTGTVDDFSTPDTSNKDAKQQEAQQAMQNGATSGTFPYNSVSESGYQQSVSVRTIARNGNTGSRVNATYNNTFAILSTVTTTSGAWQIISEDPKFVPSALPESDLKNVTIKYYRLPNGEDNLDGKEALGDGELPTDAGSYYAEAELYTKTYNAYGDVTFTISPREVSVQQIENWLLYVKTSPGAAPIPIGEPGEIVLENVVGKDIGTDAQGKPLVYVDMSGGSVYYNDNSLAYGIEKITLENAVLVGGRAFNYTLHYNKVIDEPPKTLIYVFGQIAFSAEGSTFRRSGGDGDLWYKYYPKELNIPVGFEGNDADYHSPPTAVGNAVEHSTHSEYVSARTVNDGSGARYAVDIEYGAMHFGYYRGMWDVSSLTYIELPESFWGGMDGINNRIVLNNYSNAEVYYSITVNIYPYYDQIDATRGIRGSVSPNANGTGEMLTWTPIAAATPGDSSKTGSKASSQCFLFLAGVPQIPESVITEVGILTVTLAPNPPGSS